LAILPVDENYQSLQRLNRHRGNLVKQRAKLQVQIRGMMHESMPGYDELFIQHQFFKKSVAMPVAKNFTSAAAIKRAGPIEHYASARAINGRAGLFPSRYQSDTVDHQGGLSRSCNRRLRGAAMMVAKNLIKCHPYHRGLCAF